MLENFGMLNGMLSSSVEDAVKYDFCHFVPYASLNNLKWKPKEDEWIRELSRDWVIQNLKPKELKFNLFIKSKKFPLKARIELVVITEKEHIPVFSKLNLGRDWKLEIVGKVVLLEEYFACEISRVLVYLLDYRVWIELPIYQTEKQTFIELASKMREKSDHSKCELCELRHTCSILPGWI